MDTEFATQLLRLAGSLALVLAVLVGLLFGLKRLGIAVKKSSAQSPMEVVSKQSFGPRHHLLLVRVPGGQNVLVGISPQNMSILPTAPQPAEASVPAAQAEKV